MVIELPTNILGFIDDHFFRYVTDLGNLGPDKGQGEKYLILPPEYKSANYVVQAKTYGNNEKFYIYHPEKTVWMNPFAYGHEFKDGNIRDLDSRSIFHFYAIEITSAMSFKFVGKGSQYNYKYTYNYI